MFRSTAMILAFFGSLVFFAGCGGSDDEGLGACPTDSAVQQMEGLMVLTNNCLGCHSSTSTNRMGAPETANFDDATTVKNSKDAIYAKVNGTYTSGSIMPPTGMLGAEAIDDIRVYLSCLQ